MISCAGPEAGWTVNDSVMGSTAQILTLNDVLQCLVHGRGDADRHGEAPVLYQRGMSVFYKLAAGLKCTADLVPESANLKPHKNQECQEGFSHSPCPVTIFLQTQQVHHSHDAINKTKA